MLTKLGMKNLPTGVKKSFVIWLICLLLFIFLIVFDNSLKETFLKDFLDNFIIGPLAVGFALGGIISFLFSLITLISYFLKRIPLKRRNLVIKILKVSSIIMLLSILLFILIYTSINGLSNALGFISSPIPLSGTGSMYPTFPKGEGKTPQEQAKEVVGSPGMLPYPNGLILFGTRYLNHNLQRGDIIIFQNLTTETITKKQYGEATGFAKRIIALPGDLIEIRSGLVYLNGKPLKEPYIAKPHSTFAEAFLSECRQLKVPPNKVFAMGDNRKGSGDSREFGFVDFKDINHVLPLTSQKGIWDKNWRDTGNDLDEASKIKLDKIKYLELLNAKRKEAGVQLLRYQPLLEQSAFKRGEIILKFEDFSYNATRSGYIMEKAMRDVGYSNIIWNEAFLQGYYGAEEAIEYYFEFPEWQKFLLGKDFQEVGISEVEGEINGCPTQIIVQHFAGYVSPNYTVETIDGWGRMINGLNNVIPSWEKVKDWPGINKDDLNKLLGLMYKRKNNAEAIYYRMKANQWLTNDEDRMTNEDKSLYDQIEALANKLNGK